MTTWQIGESGTAIALDGTGKGEVTFTVTNAGTAADRAVLTITPLDGASHLWFSVPEPQRQVAAGASALYPVGVAVPSSTAAGTYGLQGVAYSADSDPAESSATSKRISLTVAPPPAGKGVPRWIWLVVAAIVLLVVGVVAFLATRGGEDDDGPPDDPTPDPTAPLANTAPPSLGGAAVLSRTLTADAGEWSVELDSVAFRWERCSGTDDACKPIEGETGAEYVVVADDIDHSLAVEVTAAAGQEEVTARSAPSPVVPGLAVVEPPTISGSAAVGQALTATTGTWSPPEAALALQWQRCNPQVTACEAIAGETRTSYVVQQADVAGAVRAEIRASLAGATDVAHTPPTGTVAVPDVRVPEVVGETQAEASSRLTGAGLQPVAEFFDSSNPSACNGFVTSQDPADGEIVPAGTRVRFRVPVFKPSNPNSSCP